MITDLKAINEFRHSDEYIFDIFPVYNELPNGKKWLLKNLIGSDKYEMLSFIGNEMYPYILNLEEYIYNADVEQDGFKDQLVRELISNDFNYIENVKTSIEFYKQLLKIYDKNKFPKEVKLVKHIIYSLTTFVDYCNTHTIDYTEKDYTKFHNTAEVHDTNNTSTSTKPIECYSKKDNTVTNDKIENTLISKLVQAYGIFDSKSRLTAITLPADNDGYYSTIWFDYDNNDGKGIAALNNQLINKLGLSDNLKSESTISQPIGAIMPPKGNC